MSSVNNNINNITKLLAGLPKPAPSSSEAVWLAYYSTVRYLSAACKGRARSLGSHPRKSPDETREETGEPAAKSRAPAEAPKSKTSASSAPEEPFREVVSKSRLRRIRRAEALRELHEKLAKKTATTPSTPGPRKRINEAKAKLMEAKVERVLHKRVVEKVAEQAEVREATAPENPWCICPEDRVSLLNGFCADCGKQPESESIEFETPPPTKPTAPVPPAVPTPKPSKQEGAGSSKPACRNQPCAWKECPFVHEPFQQVDRIHKPQRRPARTPVNTKGELKGKGRHGKR
jgi:hypothetical protein